MNYMRFQFPTGDAEVEITPETAKLNINFCQPGELFRLLLVLGVPGPRAQLITAAIIDWRSMLPPGTMTQFDPFYLGQPSSFRARHASLEETEELLLVQGMTPEIYYGTFDRGPNGGLVARPGLKDCVSVYGSTGGFDVNSVHPALMQALGFTPETIQSIVMRRRMRPIRGAQEIAPLMQAAGPIGQRLRVGRQYDVHAALHGAAAVGRRALLGFGPFGSGDGATAPGRQARGTLRGDALV